MSVSELEHEPKFEHAPIPEIYETAQVLVDAFTLSDQLTEELRPQLWNVGEKVANQVIEPEKRNAIVLLTGIIDWYWFNSPGQQVPPGMVLVDYGGDDFPTPALDQRIPYMNNSISEVVHEFRRTGMYELETAVLQDFYERKDQIDQAAQAIIRGSAEYALLKSFDDPQRKPERSPLNPFWRQVRERQIEQDVRKRHALAHSDNIVSYTQAGQDYRRQVYQLDHETMVNPQSQTSSHDAVLRARSYVLPFVAAAYKEQVGQAFDCVYYEDGTGLCVRGIGDDEGPELYDFSRIAAYDLAEKIGLTQKLLRFIPEKFLMYAIERVVDPRQTDTLASIIEDSVQSAIDHIYDTLKCGIVPHFGSYPDIHDLYHSEVISLLRQPKGPIYDGNVMARLQQRNRYEVTDYDWHNTFRSMSNFATESEIYHLSQMQYGQVEAYGPANFRVPARLVGTHKRDVELPREADSPDLVISIDPFKINRDEVPFIPGYTLVSEHYDLYGFVVSPEGDPYRDCNVIVNANKRKELAEHYRSQLGMHELADKVETHKRLTVVELVDYIRGHSDYHLPEALESFSMDDRPLTARKNYINSPSDFSKFVVHGRLQTQCTGSAHFLRNSLSLIFGNGCAGVIDGHVIKSSTSQINGAQHAQTIFNHGGKQYILDSTPSAHIRGGAYKPIHGGDDYTKRRLGGRALQLDRASHKDLNPVPSEVAPTKTIEQETDELITGLGELLKGAFGAPNDAQLYKYLVTLASHDPARKAYETLVRFRVGVIDVEGVKSASGYLKKLSEADKETRTKLGFAHYSPDFVESLRSTVWRLGFAIERQQDVRELN